MTAISTHSPARPYVLESQQRWAITLVHAGWLSAAAALGLSLLSVYAIHVAVEPGARGFSESLDALFSAPLSEAAKQLMFLGMGVVAAAVATLPHYRLIGRFSWALMGVSLGLLLFLLVPGVPASIVKPVNGARCWIDLGLFKLQPSELAKISFVLVVAHYLRFRSTHRRFLGLAPVGLIAAVPLGLIMLEPDLGTVLLFIPALFAMLIAAGARLRHLMVIVVAAGLAAPAMYPFLKPHQKARIMALASQVQGDREGAYDINYQSFTAQRLVGSGRIAGNGDGHARALVRFNRLPESHNDFIFSVVCTRFGVMGGIAVMLMHLAWLAGALLVAGNCKDPFGRLVCVGLFGFVAAQVVINIGMNIGLLPVIGITLPFMSYGGSSMITMWLMTGLIVNIAMRRPLPPYRPSFEWEDE